MGEPSSTATLAWLLLRSPGGRILWTRYPDGLGGVLDRGGLARAIAVGPGDTIAVGGALVPPEGVEEGSFYVGSFTPSGD
jgi:hypothetical protein